MTYYQRRNLSLLALGWGIGAWASMVVSLTVGGGTWIFLWCAASGGFGMLMWQWLAPSQLERRMEDLKAQYFPTVWDQNEFKVGDKIFVPHLSTLTGSKPSSAPTNGIVQQPSESPSVNQEQTSTDD